MALARLCTAGIVVTNAYLALVTASLMIIDAQRNMLEPPGSIPNAAGIRQRLEELIHRARTARDDRSRANDGGPNDPDAPGTPGWELVFTPMPSEKVVRKSVRGVFESNPALVEQLRERGVAKLVVAGMQSEWCIAASVLAAERAGFEVDLVRDAHATYNGTSCSADDIARQVERDLQRERVRLATAMDVTFD